MAVLLPENEINCREPRRMHGVSPFQAHACDIVRAFTIRVVSSLSLFLRAISLEAGNQILATTSLNPTPPPKKKKKIKN